MNVKEFRCDSGVGLMRKDKVVIPCEWSSFKHLELPIILLLKSNGKEYIIAVKNDKSYLLNVKNGKTIAEFDTTNINYTVGSTFIHYTDKSTNKNVIYNLITGKSMSIEKNTKFTGYANYFTIKDNNKLKYYNINMKLIYTEE